MAHADRRDGAGETLQHIGADRPIVVAGEFAMDGREAGSPPVPCQRPDPFDLVVELSGRHALEPGHETGPGCAGAFATQAIEGGVVFETGVVEPYDDARRPGRHDVADREAGRIFEDEDFGPGLAPRRGVPAVSQGGIFRDHQRFRQAGQHAGAAILECDGGRRAERRQHPGRVRPRAAKGEAHRHVGPEPGGAVVPIEPDLAADAAGRTALQEGRESRGFRRVAGFEQRRHVVHLDPGIDAGTHAAERQTGACHDVGQPQAEVSITGRPIVVHDAVHSALLLPQPHFFEREWENLEDDG